jgi:hypothetical protein
VYPLSKKAVNHFGNDGSGTGVGFSHKRRWGESQGNGDGGMTVLGIRSVLDMYKHIIAHYDINAGELLERLVNLGLARRDGNRWLPLVKYGTALQLFQEITLVGRRPLTNWARATLAKSNGRCSRCRITSS